MIYLVLIILWWVWVYIEAPAPPPDKITVLPISFTPQTPPKQRKNAHPVSIVVEAVTTVQK